MAVNNSLAQEILEKSGTDACIAYLIQHESMTIQEATDYASHLQFWNDKQLNEQIVPVHTNFEHYCMRDNEIWIGDTQSKCPICHTDGVITDSVPVNSIKQFFSNIVTSIVLFKRKVLG